MRVVFFFGIVPFDLNPNLRSFSKPGLNWFTPRLITTHVISGKRPLVIGSRIISSAFWIRLTAKKTATEAEMPFWRENSLRGASKLINPYLSTSEFTCLDVQMNEPLFLFYVGEFCRMLFNSTIRQLEEKLCAIKCQILSFPSNPP